MGRHDNQRTMSWTVIRSRFGGTGQLKTKKCESQKGLRHMNFESEDEHASQCDTLQTRPTLFTALAFESRFYGAKLHKCSKRNTRQPPFIYADEYNNNLEVFNLSRLSKQYF